MSLISSTQVTDSPTSKELSRRLGVLEKEVARLKARRKESTAKKNWWHALAGKFDSDPVYAEIAKEGRKWRESQRPVPHGSGKPKKGRADGARS